MQTAVSTSIPKHIAGANKFFIYVLWGMLLFSMALAHVDGTWTIALVIGSLAAIVPTLLIIRSPGSLITRLTVGACAMIFCGLNIHQVHGLTELHFGIFVLLALLLCYEDWRVIAVAAAVIATHHLAFTLLQNAGYGVMCMPAPGMSMVLVHAAYVVVESAALSYLAILLSNMTANTAASQAKLQANLQAMNVVAIEAQRCITMITACSEDLASSSRSIADGAQQQAAGIEQTAASLEEITSTAENGASNAKEVSRLSESAVDIARQGGVVVEEAVGAMTEINGSAVKISDIISTINEIAFQTNLLAVNAAVEAARAGDAGRGFAVVAAEVRSLAQRAAGASKEIKALIGDSLHKVEQGAALVTRSGKSLEEIVGAVARVHRMAGDIANGSEEQCSGITQINVAMSVMDRVTQTNAAETEQMANLAESLTQQSANLSRLIAHLTEGAATADAADKAATNLPQPHLVQSFATQDVNHEALGEPVAA